MKVRITVAGVEHAVGSLRAAGESIDQPKGPLLEVLAAELQTAFQGNIQEAKGPDGPWPDLRRQTVAIRKHYGHGSGPRLVRSGDLLQSITTLAQGDDFVEVGTRNPAAAILQTGGTVSDQAGTRDVQAFPFIWLGDQRVQDFAEMIREYYFGG